MWGFSEIFEVQNGSAYFKRLGTINVKYNVWYVRC